jgi:hypothetical protein
MGKTTIIAILVAGAATGAAGCGDSFSDSATNAPADNTSATPTSVPSTSTEPAQTTTSSPTTSSPTTTASSSSSGSTSSTDNGPLDADDEGRGLTLNDFFDPSSYWEEDRYDIAGQKDVQGIAAPVSGCGSYSQEIELRLGNNFERLEFSVGQADNSAESDQSLSVEILANNSQVEIRSVPFNEIQSFSISVTGVNALKIRFGLDERVPNCTGSVIGVITDAALT